MPQRIQLLSRDGHCVATGEVDRVDTAVTGVVDLNSMPLDIRATFERFETTVNDQMLSLIDSIESEIGRLGISARFGAGQPTPICDLQIFPSTGQLSCRVATTAVRAAN